MSNTPLGYTNRISKDPLTALLLYKLRESVGISYFMHSDGSINFKPDHYSESQPQVEQALVPIAGATRGSDGSSMEEKPIKPLTTHKYSTIFLNPDLKKVLLSRHPLLG